MTKHFHEFQLEDFGATQHTTKTSGLLGGIPPYPEPIARSKVILNLGLFS